MLGEWHREAERALSGRDFRRAHALCLQILAEQPDHADALFLLGMIAAEHGNYAKALEVIDRALALAPEVAEYHAQRGRCLIALHRPRAAFEAARQAERLAPAAALTLDTIGVVLTRAGAHAEAVGPFRAAVARDGSKPSYRYNLGAALQFVGDFAGAEAEYRHALAIQPMFFRAWSSLAQVARASLTASDVATLERILDDPALDADAELHICHALAKQLEDEGQYAAAFRYLERGKRRKRTTLGYDAGADAALFAAAAATADVTPQGDGHPSREPIFIVGMPRTGTTLVERILSSHPRVFAAGELTNFSLAVKRAAGTEAPRVLDAATLTAGARNDAHAIGTAYLESTRPRTGHTERFIDKMPLNFFYVPLIQRALPNAKIICVRRNALDTCLSNYRQLFALGFSYYNYAHDLLDTGRYFVGFQQTAECWRRKLTTNYLEVYYEQIIADSERETHRLLEFCELPFDGACLAFERNAAPVATASSVQVRQPIYRSAVERWRHYERELAPLKELLASHGVL